MPEQDTSMADGSSAAGAAGWADAGSGRPVEDVQVVVGADEESRVEALLKALGDRDWRVRRAAASSIPDVETDLVSKPLYDLLASEDAGARNAAIKAFVRMGSPALEHLVPGLADSDPDVRNFCVLALGLIGDRAATRPLMDAMRIERDPNVEYMIMEALGRLRDPAAVPCLMEALGRDAWIKAPAVDALGRMRCADAVTALTGVLDDDLVGGVAAEALGRMGDVRATLPLARSAGRASGFASDTYLTALASLLTSSGQGGPLLHQTLLPLVADEDRRQLSAAVSRALERGRAAHAALTIADWLDDPGLLRPVVAAMGDVALHDHGLRVIARFLSRTAPEEVARIAEEASVHSRQVMLEAVSLVGAGGRAEWIPESLRHANPLIVAAACKALGNVGGPQDAREMLPLLGHALEEVRRAAAEGVGRIGIDGVAGDLLELAEHGSVDQRVAVGACLAQRAGWSGEDLERAACILSDSPEKAVRLMAARAIAIAPADLADRLAESACTDAEAGVRRAAADALGRTRSAGARSKLYSLIKDDDAGVRVAALGALTDQVEAEDVDVLQSSLGDRDPRVRIAALGALAALGRREAIPAIRRTMDETNPDVFCAALHALASADPAEAEAVAVGALLASDWHMRAASVDLLRGVGGESAQDAIRRGLGDEDRAVRCAAIAASPRVLGAGCIPELLALIDDDEVAGAAEDALLQVACDAPGNILGLIRGATGRQRSALLRIAVSIAAGDEGVLLPLLESEAAEDRFYAVLGLSCGSQDAIWAVKEASRSPQEAGVAMAMAAVVAAHARASGTQHA